MRPAPGSTLPEGTLPRRTFAQKCTLPPGTFASLVGVIVLWAVYYNVIDLLATDVVYDPGQSHNPNFRNELHGYILTPADAPPLARWDSVWYQSIATEGYPAPRGIGVYNVGFLPLYGFLMRAVAHGFHVSVLVAGVWVSRAALLGAMVLLWIEGRARSRDASSAWAPVAALLAFPTAYLLTAVYAEACFLFFSLAAWMLAARKNYLLAFLPAYAAALTRMHALALLPALGVQSVMHWWPQRRRLGALWVFAPAVGVAAGLGSLAGYFQHVAHDPFLYFTRKRFFGSVTGGPTAAWTSSWNNFHTALMRHSFGALYTLLEIPTATLLLLAAAVLVVQKRYDEGTYVLATLGLSIAAGSLWGIPRYSLLVFPLFLLAGRALRVPWVWYGYLVGGALLQACLLVNYVNLHLPAP